MSSKDSLLFEKITLLKYCLSFFITSVVPYRSESPPVPAVRNRLLQVQHRQMQASPFLVHKQLGGREDAQAAWQQNPAAAPRSPPPARFVPYVRTREVFCLPAGAPLSSASAQHSHGTGKPYTECCCFPLHPAVTSLCHSSAQKGCTAKLYSLLKTNHKVLKNQKSNKYVISLKILFMEYDFLALLYRDWGLAI